MAGSRGITHIVWDWNGTLFRDSDVVVDATVETFASLGVTTMTAERYRATYRHPVRLFYEQVLGRPMTEAEMLRANDTFRDAYHRRISECDLMPGAQEVIDAWRDRGGSQSVLSLYQHDLLVPLVTRLGLAEVFARIEGRREDVPGQKAEYMVRHLDALGVEPARTLVVGDTVDDAHAAAHAGARCVLHDGGQQSLEVLRSAGVPVVDTLHAVLEYVDSPG